MKDVEIFIGESKLIVYNIRLIKGEFLVLIPLGLKNSSTIFYNKLKSIENAISICWSDIQIFLDPKNIELKLESYSIVMTFKIGDIK